MTADRRAPIHPIRLERSRWYDRVLCRLGWHYGAHRCRLCGAVNMR